MADISRAMQTPPPAAAPAPQPAQPQHFAPSQAADAAKEAKNERARLKRKAKRAADVKAARAAQKTAALKSQLPKKKKAKVKNAKTPKKRGRGRPPGAKNKPKDTAAFMAPRVIGNSPLLAAPYGSSDLAAIQSCVNMLNAMPEHARKVVLDAVK